MEINAKKASGNDLTILMLLQCSVQQKICSIKIINYDIEEKYSISLKRLKSLMFIKVKLS